MKFNTTQLEWLLRMVYASNGYNDGERVPNDLAITLHDEIELRREILMTDRTYDEAKEHGLNES